MFIEYVCVLRPTCECLCFLLGSWWTLLCWKKKAKQNMSAQPKQIKLGQGWKDHNQRCIMLNKEKIEPHSKCCIYAWCSPVRQRMSLDACGWLILDRYIYLVFAVSTLYHSVLYTAHFDSIIMHGMHSRSMCLFLTWHKVNNLTAVATYEYFMKAFILYHFWIIVYV